MGRISLNYAHKFFTFSIKIKNYLARYDVYVRQYDKKSDDSKENNKKINEEMIR